MQRTYSLIQFKIEEEETPDKKMNYNESLNTIRILQEAVNNAVKHASCTVIKCNKYYKDGKIVFTVQDNGRGVNNSDAEESTGSGIENMRHRAKNSLLEFTITPAPDKGTLVCLYI